MNCDKCKTSFSRRDNLRRHLQKTCPFKEADDIPTKKIKLSDPSTRASQSRKRLHVNISSSPEEYIEKLQHAFKDRIASYRFKSSGTHIDYYNFMEEIKPKVLNIISECLEEKRSLKINFELFGQYVIPEKEMSDIKSFNTKNKIITYSTDLDYIYEEFKDEMVSKASEFQERDSGWSLQKIWHLDVNINIYNPLSASSYIKLPKTINRKQAVLNVKNFDNACFAWSIMAAIFPSNGNPSNPSSYPHYTTLLDFEGIDFPVKLKDVSKFERMNNISVNVFGMDTKFIEGKMVTNIVGPLHFTTQRSATHVNLLLIADFDGNNHYCLITDLSRLVSLQKSKHKGRLYTCDGCLQFFPTIEKLTTHQKYDCNHLCVILPKPDMIKNKYGEVVPGNILKFTNFEKQLPVPFVIYADFESLLKPIHHSEPSDEHSFTLKAYEHEPYSFGLYVKCNFDDKYSEFIQYRGLDCAEVFVKMLDELVLKLYNKHLKHVKEMLPLSEEEDREFQISTKCHICGKIYKPEDMKVRDHCHLTGAYRASAHSTCNLQYKLVKFIPVFFHNLTNYDCHLFIKKLSSNKENISVIAQTKEKYISFSKSYLVEKSENPKIRDKYISLRFVDSFRFLSKSLDNLSKTLKPSQCREVGKYFQDEKKFNMIRFKGIFPYSYVDSYEKLDQPTIPTQSDFFDILSGREISEEDYDRACGVWQEFECSTLGEYSDVYLKSDVLLLADIFENFRDICLEKYKLDPAHYITAPSLSWDAMLRLTKVELELLTDIEMVHFFKKGIRGGVSQCSKRKAIANNPFISSYDPSRPNSYILYLDATNLYGAAMSEYLPKRGFRWLEQYELDNFDCFEIGDTSSKGYVLEVDLDYPSNLHDDHNDLPFCPENIKPPGSKYSKLTPNLMAKERYIIHYRNLKQCLKYGLKLKRIHRVLEFSQSAWLKQYIDLNTKLRNSARNEFERDLFKFIINSIFGKTMENVDKRQDIKLCSHWNNMPGSVGVEGLIAKPHFKSCTVFDENLVAVQMEKLTVTYDKPLYVGFSILDISKTVIYDFYYGYIKTKYGEDANLCYTDTDSLILEVFTENVYDDMKENIEYFDTSNFKIDNIHMMPKTVSVVGKMKDEFSGSPVECFYGTGAKAYCVKSTAVMKKAKGVSKNVTQNTLQISDYIRIVERGGCILRKMYVFTSHLHTIYTELRNKIALSSSDDKRFVLPNNMETLAWGHHKLTPKDGDTMLDLLITMADNLIDT